MAEVLAVVLLTILFVYSVNSDVLVPESHRSKSLIETCTSDCLKKVNVESNDIGNADSCSRGCRLFMIAALISDKQDADQNASRNSCKDMCQESYGVNNVDVLSCKVGCDLSVVQNVQVPVVAEVSWSLFIDNGNSLQILQGEIPETDDVLTDPGLRSQVSRLESMRLPQVSLRTLPVQYGHFFFFFCCLYCGHVFHLQISHSSLCLHRKNYHLLKVTWFSTLLSILLQKI
ncbi:unnamed protein product [Nezara viridula]|uniref:Neuropeptide n=1 Tax=Nezara viridula TaxID=85310 RepID=A0A9P0H5D6_NEZVI|nr:unnamed protein product [Nezara viridula]